MEKFGLLVMSSAFLIILNLNACASATHSEQAIKESGEAASHASASLAHGIIASGQVTSAVSAIPLAVVGSVGAVSAEISKDLLEVATTPIGTPLEITDETVTVGLRPEEALSTKELNKNINR